MEKYKAKFKKRMIFEMAGVVAFIPLSVYALIRYWNTDNIIQTSPGFDFLDGFLNGVRSGIVIAFALYFLFVFIRNLLAFKNEEKLKKMYVEENDERLSAINKMSSHTTYYITMLALLVSCIIIGLYNSTVSLTLLAVLVFLLVVRVISLVVLNSKM